MPDTERELSDYDDDKQREPTGHDLLLEAPPAGAAGETVQGGVSSGGLGGDPVIGGSVVAEDWGRLPAADAPAEAFRGTVAGNTTAAGAVVKKDDGGGDSDDLLGPEGTTVQEVGGEARR
jgi:hypothetical protein